MSSSLRCATSAKTTITDGRCQRHTERKTKMDRLSWPAWMALRRRRHRRALQDLKHAIQRVPAAASAEARERGQWIALVDQLAAVPGAGPLGE